MSKQTSKGFTLVELLVVIAIIGVLVALLLPAVQSARESARRAQCTTQLRELGQATITFEGAKKRYPGWQEIIARNAGATLDTAGGANKSVGWPILLMPYLDQQQIYDVWDDQTIARGSAATSFLPIYTCPSRQSQYRTGTFISYVANAGYMPRDGDQLAAGTLGNANIVKAAPDPAAIDYWDLHDGRNGIFVDRIGIGAAGTVVRSLVPTKLPEVNTTDIDDGLSNTLLFSENLVAGRWTAANPGTGYNTSGSGNQAGNEITFHWFFASDGAVCSPAAGVGSAMAVWKINSSGTSSRPPADPNNDLNDDTARPSSWHSGGVNAVFADKHTAFLSDGLDYDVYQQLMTTYGKKSRMPCNGYVLRAEDFGE